MSFIVFYVFFIVFFSLLAAEASSFCILVSSFPLGLTQECAFPLFYVAPQDLKINTN